MKVVQIPTDEDVRPDDMQALMDSPGWLHAVARIDKAIEHQKDRLVTLTPTTEDLRERQGVIKGMEMAKGIPAVLKREAIERRKGYENLDAASKAYQSRQGTREGV